MALFKHNGKREKKNDLEVRKSMAVEESNESVVGFVDEPVNIIPEGKALSISFDKLAMLGSAFASIVPYFRTVTETTTVDTTGVYKVVNNTAGEALKVAKNGDKWGSFVNSEGKSVMARLADVESLDVVKKTTMPVNPTMIMMAVALNSIEEDLDEILEMEKQIFSFIEQDKEAEVEGDFKNLSSLIQTYKYNWENMQYRQATLNQVMSIKNTSEKNIIFYQKQIKDDIKTKSLIIKSKMVNSVEKELGKAFAYYKMSLYNYVLASLMEVFLNENFQEDYIQHMKSVIKKYSEEYAQAYKVANQFISKMAEANIEANIVKGIGAAGETIGNVMGKIPVVNKGPVDGWIVEGGTRLKNVGKSIEQKALKRFELLQNPGTDVFVDKLNEINWIYNHAEVICCDKEKVWLE